MPTTTPDQRARRLSPGELITLYELDLTGLGAPSVFYFHDGIDQGANQIGFATHTYVPMPIKAEGFEMNSRGTLPRPKMTVSNIGSVISSLLLQYGDFVGGTLKMRMTFSVYVLRNGVKVDATEYDAQPPWKEFTPQIFTIDRKASETNTFVAFELATPMDSEGILLPRRQILATACPFTYRGTECGYPAPPGSGNVDGKPKTNRLGANFTGTLVDRGAWSDTATYAVNDYAYVLVGGVRVYAVCKAGHNNSALLRSFYDENFWMLDVCLKKQSDCEKHFDRLAQHDPLPYGGYPGANKLT
jgi:lambda-like phage minor tail protein L